MGCCTSTECCKPLPDITGNFSRQTLEGNVYWAYCKRVVDGDTAILNIYFPTQKVTYEYNVRLRHIDAPEMKSEDVQEKVHATASKLFLKDLIFEKHVIVVCDEFDKYGRLLGSLYVRGKLGDNQVLTEGAIPSDVKKWYERRLLDVSAAMLKYTPCTKYEGKSKENFKFDPSLKNYHKVYRDHYEMLSQRKF